MIRAIDSGTGLNGRMDMADNSYTVFNAMVDIVASPGKALDEIRQRYPPSH